jgi:hypothetical protein
VKIEQLKRVVDNVAGRTPTLNANLERVNSVASDLSKMTLAYSRDSPSDAFGRHSPLSTPMQTPEMMARDLSRSPTQTSPGSISESSPGDSRTTAGPSSPRAWGPQMRRTAPGRVNVLTITPESPTEVPSSHRRSASDTDFPRLPPAAMDEDEVDTITPAPRKELTFAPPKELPDSLQRNASTRSQQERFEKTVFRHSAILCDL